MDDIFILLLFLSVCLIVEGGRKMTSKYDVQKDTSVDSSIQPLELYQKASLASCAFKCNINHECGSATYSADDMSCSLYSCFFPTTVTTSGAKHLRKLPIRGSIDFPADCSELPTGSISGVYTVYPTESLQIDVYCDFTLEPGTGWTVVQRRINGTIDFYVNWEAYREGFGDIRTEFWIGNNILNIMTYNRSYILRFDMEDANGNTRYANYTTFVVADECSQYKLTIDGYSGTAGDSMENANGMKFSTLDMDNDLSSTRHCAEVRSKGGWWYNDCTRVNANGLYLNPGTPKRYDSIFWREFKDFESLKTISMKIKPL